MGVRDLKEVLRRLGLSYGKTEISRGQTLAIDAMQTLMASHARVTRRAEPPPGPDDPTTKWVLAIISDILAWVAPVVAAGVVPVMFWDPVAVGGERTEGKHPSHRSPPLYIRRTDIETICATIRAVGVPTVIAWTEGEKVASAANIGGAVDAVVSTDTDCFVLGARLVGRYAFPNRAGGVTLGDSVTIEALHQTIDAATEEKGHAAHRLVDAAVFLGCDFCSRDKGNGPAAYVKRITSGAGPYPCDTPEAQKTYEFFNVSKEDIDRATALTAEALKRAWSIDHEAGDHLGDPFRVAMEFADVLRRPLPPDDEPHECRTTCGAAAY